MSEANLREERRVVRNMTAEELREVVKDIPSEILIDEINYRTELTERKIATIGQVLQATR